jgi:hypothetical protein
MAIKEIEIEISVQKRTEKALLVDFGGKMPVWVPLSIISDYTEEPDGSWSSIFIPEWIAQEKEMI